MPETNKAKCPSYKELALEIPKGLKDERQHVRCSACGAVRKLGEVLAYIGEKAHDQPKNSEAETIH